ncbi:uncharacterized protein LOC134831401 [Culicoides brevitarsis]|uniref:uncharacterized protein LOC134831401 n=1 Tax=Culicoides brevitarsis TaxID=469753 RepID=UPI00307C3000
MACIDDLFDWILEIIFQQLPLRSRLTCKEVCKRWCELLMTRAIFRADRHIYLNKCLIEPHRPPMSVFLNAKYRYQIVTLDNGNIYLPFVNDFDSTIEFWKYLGESVTEMHIYNNIRPALYRMFFEMPNLKLVSFDGHLTTLTEDLLMEEDEGDGPMFPSLERIICKKALYGDAMSNDRKKIESLRSLLPENAKIVIDKVEVNGTNFEELWKTEKVEANDLRIFEGNEGVIEKLISCETLPVKCTKLIYRDETNPSLSDLNKFLTKHLNITQIKIASRFVQFPFTQITHLTISKDGDEPLRSFKVFQPLVNLERLSIKFRDQVNCLYGHEPIELPKLKKLSLIQTNLHCSNCMKAIASSFPSMEIFHAYINIEDCVSLLGEMFKNWRNLKEMRVVCQYKIQNFGEAFRNFSDDEQQLNFRLLELSSTGQTKLTGADMLKMSKIFPYLHTMAIDMDESVTNLDDVVKGIFPAFKDMTSLQIRGRRNWVPIKEETAKAVVAHIEMHGHSLRAIDLPLMRIDLANVVPQLYRKLPNLCVYENGRERWCVNTEL